MKKLISLSVSLLLISVVHAQSCSSGSGSWVCTPSGTLTQQGYSPASGQIAPFVNGTPASLAMEFLNFDTITVDEQLIDVQQLHIVSITNLPQGLCWATNKSGNTFNKLEHGCLVISGTPCDLPGQYKIGINVSVMIGGYWIPATADDVGQSLFLRLKNNGDADTPVDVSETASLRSYGLAPSCTLPNNYLRAYFDHGDTVCKGYNASVNVITNIPFDPANQFYLEVSNTCSGASSNRIRANQGGSYTFRIPGDTWICDLETTVHLYSTNPAMSVLITDVIYASGPTLGSLEDTYNECGSDSITLNDYWNPPSGQLYDWYELPGSMVISNNAKLKVMPSVTTQYRLITSMPWGCSVDTTVDVTFSPLPNPNITDHVKLICPGGSTTLGVPAVPNYFYWWSDSLAFLGFYSFSASPSVSPAQSTSYYLQVIDSNFLNCALLDTVRVNVKGPTLQELCMVTVDSTSKHNIIVWEKADKPTTDSFFIYREVTTNNYVKIGAVHRDSLSEYHDSTSNPNAAGYRYKISVVDTCLNEGTLSSYHNSVHLQYLGYGNLQWNSYGIENQTTPVASFEVYRDADGTGTWQLLISVSGTQTTATDPDFSLFPNARYRVQVNRAGSCTPSRSMYAASVSNIIALRTTGFDEIQHNVLQLYPNPVVNSLNINTGGLPIERVLIYNTDSKLLIENSEPLDNTIDVSRLAAGVYMVVINVRDKEQRIRFLKM